MRALTRHALLIFCLVSLTACGTTRPSRFYLLTAAEMPDSGSAAAQSQTIGIGPVSLPAYLDRSGIVLRISDNQLQYAEFDRWAEPFKATFTRTMLDNLSVMLPDKQVVAFPWPRSTTVDYRVVIDVTRFDADAAGTVVLAADWTMMRAEDSTVLERSRATYTEAAGGTDYPDIVAAQSRALGQLSRDIADALDAPAP